LKKKENIMKIKSVTLNNIGRFIGKNTFDLDTKENRNIVYIEGENASGKTTIYKAIKYALYGSLMQTNDESSYLNDYVKLLFDENSTIYNNVKVLFNLGNSDYLLTRGSGIYDEDLFDEFKNIKCNGKFLENNEVPLLLNKMYKQMPYDLFDAFYMDYKNAYKIIRNQHYLKLLFVALFNIDLNNQFELEKTLNEVSIKAKNALDGSLLYNFTINISNDFKVSLKDESGKVIRELSASEVLLLAYAIYYAMIKISNRNNLVVFDDPFSQMDFKTSYILIKNIMSNISDQVLLLTNGLHFSRDFNFKIVEELNKFTYKKYILYYKFNDLDFNEF